jgi:uncharacterized protein (TIGR03435 family)
MKGLGALPGWAVAIAIGCAITLSAQTTPAFDVVSVKPNRSGELMIRTDTEPGGRFIAVNTPLRTLLQLAYGVEDYEIIGAPDWAATQHFDVTAVSQRELPPLEGPTHGSPLLRQMLQALLRDRFALRVHTEAREAQGLALVVVQPGRLGPRLTRSKIDCAALVAKAKPDDGFPSCGFRMSPGSIALEGVSVSALASGLTGLLNRKVVDRTGLTGTFDLQLHWDPPARSPDGRVVAAPDGVSLFTALGDQAGLRLNETRVTGTVLVVDAVQQPTAN